MMNEIYYQYHKKYRKPIQYIKWLEQNKLLENQLVLKLQENNLLLRLPERVLQQLEVLKNHTDIDQVQLH